MSRIDELEDILFGNDGSRALAKLADSGDVDAMYVLGMAHYDGDCVKVDRDRALALLSAAANLGQIKAIHDLGCFYYYGYGFSDGFKDHIKARELLVRSAIAGYEPSMTFLASMLISGEGGPKDVEEARGLLAKAVSNGSELAADMLKGIAGA